MSLLRRFKRGRAIGNGPVPPEGQAAAPVATPPTAAPAGRPADAATQVIGHAATSAQGPSAAASTAKASAAPAPGPAAAAPEAALAAPPPAGVDPTASRPSLGRRGRLRRRLRFLRRARDLMLRDLGGLVYEIHRTGGGSSERHASVIAAKVQRLDALDGEARALEAVLATPRADAIVFEPGVGGTCAACGEIHGSDARFCSACGAPIGTAVRAAPVVNTPAPPVATPATQANVDPANERERRRSFWSHRAAGPAGDADSTPPQTEPAATTATLPADQLPSADTTEFTWPVKPADARTEQPPVGNADQADPAAAERPDDASADLPAGEPRS